MAITWALGGVIYSVCGWKASWRTSSLPGVVWLCLTCISSFEFHSRVVVAALCPVAEWLEFSSRSWKCCVLGCSDLSPLPRQVSLPPAFGVGLRWALSILLKVGKWNPRVHLLWSCKESMQEVWLCSLLFMALPRVEESLVPICTAKIHSVL